MRRLQRRLAAELRLRLVKGTDFEPDDIRGAAERNFTVHLYGNGMLLGGMTYRVDPDLKGPAGRDRMAGLCREFAQRLADGLQVSGGRTVKDVSVKTVTLDIEFETARGGVGE